MDQEFQVEGATMKRALILLALVCLLIAIPMTAAAYEPTNAVALDGNYYAIKTIEKEEVAAVIVSENVALPAVPIPADEPESLMKVTLIECVYTKYGWLVEQEVDRVSSRFT
jgi:hypothetical protein